MKHDIDTLLTQALAPDEQPENRLNNEILQKAKERQPMKQRHFHSVAAAAVIICVLAAGSVSAVAAYKYLSPSRVAEINEDMTLKKAFEGKDAIEINESQTCGGYQFTLLGIVSGENLSTYIDKQDSKAAIAKGETYAVIAIEHEDGTPMPDTSDDAYGETTFLASPFIKGKNPAFYNVYTLDGAYSEFVQDGIQYRIVSCSNLEVFADLGVYLGVSENLGEQEQAFLFDEQTGEISRNPDYTGINPLFELPLDSAKADPEAAAAIFDKIENPSYDDEASSESEDETIEDEELAKWVAAINDGLINKDYLDTYGTAVESTRQVLTPDADRYVTWDAGDYGSGASYIGTPEESNWEIGELFIQGYGWGDTVDSLCFYTMTYNEDGTVTFVVYIPKES